MSVKLLHGDCVELMRAMPDCSVDAIGCEMTDEYLPIIRGRVEWAEEQAFLREEIAKAAPQQERLL